MIAVLVAALLVAQTPADTVFTVDGGRIAGTVLEDSPTAGVTIQTPDGAVRRIERAQVARIEFADGSVSTPRAAPAAPAPAQPAASPDLSVRPAAAVSGSTDTVYLSPSGRVRGTVMEESATTGVKIRRLDGSIQNYAVDEVSRIEYADGTVSTPRSAPKPAAPAPAPAPPKATAEAPLDTVYFLGGGRVRGTVIEEHPKTGVKVRLLDGTVQTYSRDELVRIEYADGTVSRRKSAPAVAPVTPPPAPPPAAAPAAPPPAPRDPLKEQPAPLYVSLGVGGTLLGGSAEKGVLLERRLAPGQAHFAAEAALRLSPSIAIGGYADAGAGDAASSVREFCRNTGQDCVGVTGRYGLLIRHTWDPLTSRPKWLSVGTGWEFASVEVDHHDGGSASDLFRYEGRELVRIGAGVDFRSNPVLALGLYGSIAWGEYDRFEDPTQTISLSGVTHTTAQLGLRLTLFP